MFGDVQTTMGSHGAIANDVLLHFRILIDYSHARLFVEPAPRVIDASASSTRVGIAVTSGADGCFEIRQLTDTNAKDTLTNLKIGDVILSVDGQDACQMPHHVLSAALAGAAGTQKKLHVRRGAATVDIEATTAELLPHK